MASLLTALLVVGLTNYFYWQPQLELLREQAKTKYLYISAISTGGWTVIDTTTACAVAHANSVFRFNVTNIGNLPILVLEVRFEASNWNGALWSSNITSVLGPGSSITVQHVWSHNEIDLGHQADFSVTITAANVPSETLTLCVVYS